MSQPAQKPASRSASPARAVCICGIGARTPLGFNAAASAAAVRAGLSAITLHDAFPDKAEDPMAFASDAEFDPELAVDSRINQMLCAAIAEASANAAFDQIGMHAQWWVGLPEPRPGLPTDIASSVSAAVSSRFRSSPPSLHLLQNGHASGLMALQAAAEAISIGEADICVAAGVDSYHDAATLNWLDTSGMLMSSSNRNGFPPGEAAGACLLASRAMADRMGLPVLATVVSSSTAVEKYPIRSTAGVCIGEALSSVLKTVAIGLLLPEQAITATYCDLNGERYRNEEFAYSCLRVQKSYVDANDYLCPADCWGDVGAASGPLFVSLAVVAGQRGYAKGLLPVMWAGSESGFRTAVLLNLANT